MQDAAGAAWGTGSPPRAWGRLRLIRRVNGWDRFTPTCVGTAEDCLANISIDSVHPHVRGDGAWF